MIFKRGVRGQPCQGTIAILGTFHGSCMFMWLLGTNVTIPKNNRFIADALKIIWVVTGAA